MSSGIVRLASLAVAVALLAGTTLAAAQQTDSGLRSNTQKLLLGLFLNGNSIDSDDFDEAQTGGGIAAQVGWGFTPMFTILVDVSGARMNDDPEDFALVHLDLLGRFNFRSGANAFVPYAEVGYTARITGQDDATLDIDGTPQTGDIELAGGAVTVGGGFHYFVSPILALGLNLKFSAGDFTEAEVDDVRIEDIEIEAFSTRLNLGITLYPMR